MGNMKAPKGIDMGTPEFAMILADMANTLRRLRLERGWTHEEAADRMGISRGQFIKLERGERRLTERTIYLAARAFGVPRAEIIADDTVTLPTETMISPKLPVYSAAEGGPGEIVVSNDPIELIARPWYVQGIKEAYAVMVTGESMVPAFEPGDLAIVNPRLPPVRGKDVILIGAEGPGEFRASIKRLLRWTERDWYCHQFNPPPGQKADLTFPRKTWTKALQIVGKKYG